MPRLDVCILSGWSPSYETLWLAFLLKVYSDVCMKIRTESILAQVRAGSKYANTHHMGGVILPLQLLASNDNVVDDIPYFPACPKVSDKHQC